MKPLARAANSESRADVSKSRAETSALVCVTAAVNERVAADEACKTYASLPLSVLETAPETWPRCAAVRVHTREPSTLGAHGAEVAGVAGDADWTLSLAEGAASALATAAAAAAFASAVVGDSELLSAPPP